MLLYAHVAPPSEEKINKQIITLKFNTMKKLVLAVTWLLMTAMASLGQNTLYVDDDFTSSTTGWGVTHFDKIQDAVNIAAANDVIQIAAGTYNENVTYPAYPGKQISFIGTTDVNGAPVTILNGSLSLNNNDNQVIKNIYFINSGTSFLLYMTNTNTLGIENCVFDGNGQFMSSPSVNGITTQGGSNGVSDVTIDQCVFKNGLYVGLSTAGTTNMTVQNSTFENIKSGINWQGSSGLVVTGCDFSVVAQAAGSDTYGIRFGASGGGPFQNMNVTNSTFDVDPNGFTPTAGTYHCAVWTRAAASGTLKVNQCEINAPVVNSSTTVPDVTCNWWGQITGPETGQIIQDGSGAMPNYEPWNNSDLSNCAYTSATRLTYFGTPVQVSCDVWEFPVQVQNFNTVGAISLVLNYDQDVFSFVSVDKNAAITAASVNSSIAGKFILGHFFDPGSEITLADNSVLFTLRFTLKPAKSGTGTSFTWSTVPTECEYAPSGISTTPYVSIFDNYTWTIPVRPVVNIDTELEYCKIQDAIDDIATDDGHTLEVNGDMGAYSTFDEQVLVYKELTINGVGASKPVVNYTGTVTGKPTLFDVSVDKVTVNNLNFKVDLAKLKSAIIASGASIDDITVKNNLIEPYNTPVSGTYSDRNAVSINYVGNTNYRVATGGVNNIVYENNVVTYGANGGFRAAIAIDEGNATITGNTATTSIKM
jgi:hypothetical protein